MARPSSAAQRSLTLTEELEKLEQSITLTLQEIDHNFSRAHRIVTSSILPVVERYAEHSNNVWEGSKFWKGFFEASANVSLNGYEEGQEGDEDRTMTATEDELLSEGTTTNSYMSVSPRAKGHNYEHSEAPSSPPGTATPRAAPAMGAYASPYETLRRQHHPSARSPSPTPSGTLPSTPRAQTVPSQDNTISTSTPDLPRYPETASKKTPANNDVLLHRILDRNYRIQATPLNRTAQRLPAPHSAAKRADVLKPHTPAKHQGLDIDLDLDSSPMEEAPEIHSALFASPARTRLSAKKQGWTAQRAKERVPGVSVLTPAQGRAGSGGRARLGAALSSQQAGDGRGEGNGWDTDSDDETGGLEGMSPPKTMQFHVPTSKLMKTPAREASRRIVEDLMMTAGGENMTDELEESPSIIRKGINFDEDTF